MVSSPLYSTRFPPFLASTDANRLRPSDYNFEMDSFGQCSLVPGLQPSNPEAWCAEHPEEIEYYEPTGYRRVPLTTCVGGLALDKESPSHACPGKQDEYDRAHAASPVAVFFAVTIPVALAAAVGWYVWRHWNGKFGQIRLGEDGSSAFDSDRPWVRYPVIALSAVVAVVMALPVVAGAVWRAARGAVERLAGRGGVGEGRGAWSRLNGGGGWMGASGRRFTTRDSFARGRGDYDAIVDEDEGELLGEDSDEEAV